MALLSLGEYRPDVSDINGQHTRTILNVVPQGDGYGPFKALGSLTSALPAACRGYFAARNTDGTVTVFAATAKRVYRLNNTNLTWVPVSKVATCTISFASPGVITSAAHGLVANDPVVFSNSGGSLPGAGGAGTTAIVAGTVYYVKTVLTADTFTISTTAGGAAINTGGTGTGTHSVTTTYSEVPSTDQWQFEQFGNRVIAVQANTVPQTYTLGTSAAFADLGGSPPTARYVTTVGRILVLSGLTSSPRRVQWCDLGDPTNWTTGIANSIDMEKGGVVRGVAGGEFGLVLQESVIRRLIYNPDATLAFNIEILSEDVGLLGPYSIIRSGGSVSFYSTKGFMRFAGGALTPIGKERVDRTVAAELDTGNLQLLIGAADPAGTRIVWGYKTESNSASTFNKMLAYDEVLDRWAPIGVTGEYLAAFAVPGITLDGLDSVSASIDALSTSLDSVSTSVGTKLSAVSATHVLGVFDGSNLEATLETPEQALDMGRRVKVTGLRPVTDATDVRGSLKHRATLQAAAATTSEATMNSDGRCCLMQDTRYAKAKMRIPAGTAWTFIAGVEPEFRATGKR